MNRVALLAEGEKRRNVSTPPGKCSMTMSAGVDVTVRQVESFTGRPVLSY